MQPSTQVKSKPQIIIHVTPGEWVQDTIITGMFGFTEDQLKKYRAGQWLEEKHWRWNPARRIVYNPVAINEWMAGE